MTGTVSRRLSALLIAAGVLLTGLPALAQGPSGTPLESLPKSRQLTAGIKPWTGDFDRMLERRTIRILVPYSPSLYYNDRGRERGIVAELAHDLAHYLNRKYPPPPGKRPLVVYLVPVPRDRLVADLPAGLGDIAIGDLTATEERLKIVDFFVPQDLKPVVEVVVTGPRSPAIGTLEDLAGKTLHVRQASGAYPSLVELNRRLVAAGKPAITLTPVPDALEDEDLMDMLGAGLLELIVVDDWRARGWAQVVPALKVHDDLVVKARGHAGWAHRKDSPKLAAALAEYYRSWAKKRELAGHRQAEYLKRLKPLMNPAGPAEWARFEQTLALFEKYGQQHGFDPLLLAAQGFQESQLDPSARGPRGAVGLMQLMPATGAEMQVGDITTADANIHAAAKYMDRQMARSFADVKFTENNRTLFAIAAYHAGPGNIAKLRKEAQRRGFDPDRWFDNMEVIAAERIGVDTTTYVRNIYKYYVGYTLQSALDETRRKAREQVRAGRN